MIRRVWTDAAVALLRELYPNTRTRDLVGILDASERQIYSKASTLGLTKSAEYLASEDSGRLRGQRGVASRFQKGATPWNKGMTGLHIGGEATQFKPGNMPHNWHPIGHERLCDGGYLQRKISDTRNTRRDYVNVHWLVWFAAGNTIPKGHALVFRDGNRQNFALENLELVTRAELMRRNSYHTNYPKEVGELIQLRSALNRKINRLTKESTDDHPDHR